MDLHNRASKGLTTSLPDSEALSSSSRGAFFLFVAFAAETASNEGFEGIFKVAIGLSLFFVSIGGRCCLFGTARHICWKI